MYVCMYDITLATLAVWPNPDACSLDGSFTAPPAGLADLRTTSHRGIMSRKLGIESPGEQVVHRAVTPDLT